MDIDTNRDGSITRDEAHKNFSNGGYQEQCTSRDFLKCFSIKLIIIRMHLLIFCSQCPIRCNLSQCTNSPQYIFDEILDILAFTFWTTSRDARFPDDVICHSFETMNAGKCPLR